MAKHEEEKLGHSLLFRKQTLLIFYASYLISVFCDYIGSCINNQKCVTGNNQRTGYV